MMKYFIAVLLIGVVAANGLLKLSEKDKAQIRGLKALLTNLDGVFPTCNLVLFSEMVDYDTADANCKSFDLGTGGDVKGNLATVNTDEKNTDLKMLLAMAYPTSSGKWAPDEWVWVGLRKVLNNDGSKKGREYHAEDWAWADGSKPLDYSGWLRGQPDQKPTKQDGVKYLQNQMRINHAGKWDDTFAFKEHPYACDYQGKYILSGNLKSWGHAKEACEAAGLIMAKVRNEGEVEEIKSAAKYFLGDAHEKTWEATNWIWLGGNDEKEEGTWVWNDGEPIEWFDTMPWRAPNPDNSDRIQGKTTQNYLSISKWGEFDDSFDHKRRARPFACQCPDT